MVMIFVSSALRLHQHFNKNVSVNKNNRNLSHTKKFSPELQERHLQTDIWHCSAAHIYVWAVRAKLEDWMFWLVLLEASAPAVCDVIHSGSFTALGRFHPSAVRDSHPQL